MAPTGKMPVYTGPGTWTVDDKSVRFEQMDLTLTSPTDVSNAAIVPRFESIRRVPTNAVLLMKGKQWPGIRGNGLTHKSPDVRKDAEGNPECLRFVLKVDLSMELRC